jgi:hypothetical protein
MHPRFALILAVLTAQVAAQPHATPLLSIADARFAQARLYRLDVSGKTETVTVFPFLVRPSTFTLHHDNRTLALHSTNPDAVVLFDPVAQTVVRELQSGPPLGNVFSVRPWHTGDYIVADRGTGGTFVRLVAADGGGMRTVFAQPAWNNQIRSVAQDLFTGEILAGVVHIGPQSGPSLIRIDPQTGAFEVLDPAQRNITSLVQDHRDGAILYGEYNGGVYRRAPDGKIETLLPASNPQGIRAGSLAFDRAPGNGILVAGGGDSIARIAFTPGGTAKVVAVHKDLPPLSMIAKDLAFERGENVIPLRTGDGTWSFAIDFAGEGGAPYVLAFSATGFTPGTVVAGRTVPLIADVLFAASVTGGLAPILQGGSGRLDPQGRAVATLDLRPFREVLSGLRIWVAAVTTDLAAPSGIATISRPRVMILD